MAIRNRAFQPTTKNIGDLLIGLMRMSTGVAQDSMTATGMTTLGALAGASLSMAPTFKEHRSGYPQVLDFKIADLLAATYKAEVEEIGSAANLAILDAAIDSLETGTPKFYSVEALAEFATGGTLSLFSPYAQLTPNLSMNFGEEFSAMPFEFEALTNSAYTNQELVYRTRVAAPSRDIANQPMTTGVDNLGIGMMQVRVGKPSRRIAGTASITPAQKRESGGAVTTATVPSATGTYTGGVDGAFVVTITDTAGPIGTVVEPDGTTTPSVSFATPALMGQGVTLGFSDVSATSFAVGDVYVVGAYTGDARSDTITGINSEYSFLTTADQVGSIQSASLETNPVYKEHYSGFPKVQDMKMLESSTVTISSAMEEINAATTALTKGFATTLYDMVFDGGVNGSLYNVPVELVMNLATGGVLSFWFPNCQLSPEGEFAPSQEWGTMPFTLEAQVQGVAIPTKRLYRQKLVTDI